MTIEYNMRMHTYSKNKEQFQTQKVDHEVYVANVAEAMLDCCTNEFSRPYLHLSRSSQMRKCANKKASLDNRKVSGRP